VFILEKGIPIIIGPTLCF